MEAASMSKPCCPCQPFYSQPFTCFLALTSSMGSPSTVSSIKLAGGPGSAIGPLAGCKWLELPLLQLCRLLDAKTLRETALRRLVHYQDY